MSKRPVDIAHLKTLQRKRRALQSREAKEQIEDKRNAVRQTTIDFFARPSIERQTEASSQASEEDNPFRLSFQSNAQSQNPFACSSQPECSSQSSFSLLENLSQSQSLAEYYSQEEENDSDQEAEEPHQQFAQVSSKVLATPDLKGTTSIIVKQKKSDQEDLEYSGNRLVINLASQDDYKTFLDDSMSDDTGSVDSDAVHERVDHDDYDISDEVFRFSRTTLADQNWNEKNNENNTIEMASDIPTGDMADNHGVDTLDGKLLSVLKQKTDNSTLHISGDLDIGKSVNSALFDRIGYANTKETQPYAPFDWGIKTSVFITSTQDFEWMETNATSRAKALSRFRSSNFADQMLLDYCNNSDHSGHTDYTLNQCLYHWAYPNASPSKEKIAANNRFLSKSFHTEADKLALQEWQDADDEWTSSFRSLFDLLSIEECDYFYYIGITISVLFRSKKFVHGNEVEAIGSRSTTAFRRHLDSAGVKYNLPFQTNDKENEATSKEVLSDLEYLESINPGSTRQGRTAVHIDNGPASFFRVKGEQAVQELVEALVSWKEPRTSDRAHGSPTLISPQCFLNATLKCAKIQQRKVRKLTKSASTGDTTDSELYKLDIHGYILPTSLLLLYNILGRQTQDEHSYWAECSTLPLTKGLNSTCEKDMVDEWAMITSRQSLPSIDQVQYTRNAYRIR